jgi:hypothetical protein
MIIMRYPLTHVKEIVHGSKNSCILDLAVLFVKVKGEFGFRDKK